MGKKAPNIKDVAILANVSIATVSHVVNGTRFVSEETTAIVRNAIRELDYRPNLTALSLRKRKSKIIGLLIPILQDDTSNIFFSRLSLGVEDELKPNNMFFFLGNTQDDVDSEISLIKNLVDRQLDGLIITPCLKDHRFVRDIVWDIPVVYVDRKPLGVENANCVMSDSETACWNAISEQINMGHRKIGIICAPIDTTANIKERLNGYLRALQEHHIDINQKLIIEGEYNVLAGYKLAERLLEYDQTVTSIMITNNIHALGALQYIKEKGLRIPEDINITIFDDYDWTRVYSPSLTVIRQNPYEMGRKAVKILMKQKVDGSVIGKTYIMSPELIKRNSWCAFKSR
jgi:LacI family transcriptional regulator